MIKVNLLSLLLITSVCSFSQNLDTSVKAISPTRNLNGVSERDPINISDTDTIHLYDSSYSGFGLVDSVVGDYRVFISGENHTYTGSNSRIWLKLIKYLHQSANVRNIMFEYGNSFGILVNKYLETGDTNLYNSLKKFAYVEYGEVFKELKEFNDSLPEKDKLYFTGIDLDRGIYPIVKALDELLPTDSVQVPDSIRLHINSIKSLAPYNDYKLKEESPSYGGFQYKSGASLKLIRENFKRNKDLYQSYLGDEYEQFRIIIEDEYPAREKWEDLQNNGAIQEYHFREDYMHRRFLAESSRREGNWFGQFGRCHTTLDIQESNSCDWYTFTSLADRIEATRDGSFTRKVLTMPIVYKSDKNFGLERKEAEPAFEKYFEDMEDNRVVLLDFKGDSILQQNFSEDFSYLILSTYEKRGEAYTEMEGNWEPPKVKGKFSMLLGSYTPDLSDLNDRFQDSGANKEFTTGAFTIGITGQVEVDKFVSLFTLQFYLKDSVTLPPIGPSSFTRSYSLSGFTYNQGVAYNMLSGNKLVDLYPGVSFGYSRFVLTTTEQALASSDVGDGFLGEQRTIKFVNDALVADISADLDFNIGKLLIGGRVGYSFDMSNPHWKSEGTILENSPETQFTGLYTLIKLGVTF